MAVRLSRRKIASYVAQQLVAGVKTNRLTLELAAFLLDTKRTNELGLIIRDVDYELSKLGVVMAQVTSAFDMTETMRLAVSKLIKDKTGASQVHLEQSIDPSVMGGVKIDLPGLQYDATVARRLTILRTNFKK